MRKIFSYMILFVLICFAIPIIFTSKMEKEQTEEKTLETAQKNAENEKSLENNASYDYKEYGIIKLLHSKTGEIQEIPIDEYLYGVVAAEMPASFEEEALKAQAIVARTYTIYKISNNNKHEGANICDDSTCCQAWISKEDRFAKWDQDKAEEYWNKIVDAVEATKGKIVTYGGKPINAFFHSNSGGKTETTLNVWGGEGYPYLQSVQTSGEDAYSQYSSELILNKEEFTKKMKEKYSNFEIDFNNEESIKILEYTEGGRIKTIKIGNLELSGVEVRSILGLKSANFSIRVEGENIKFEVTGYGHGVGMSQTGADSMAKQGSTYEEIIKHFYTGVEIENI